MTKGYLEGGNVMRVTEKTTDSMRAQMRYERHSYDNANYFSTTTDSPILYGMTPSKSTADINTDLARKLEELRF